MKPQENETQETRFAKALNEFNKVFNELEEGLLTSNKCIEDFKSENQFWVSSIKGGLIREENLHNIIRQQNIEIENLMNKIENLNKTK